MIICEDIVLKWWRFLIEHEKPSCFSVWSLFFFFMKNTMEEKFATSSWMLNFRNCLQGWWLNCTSLVWYHKGAQTHRWMGESLAMKILLCALPQSLTWEYCQHLVNWACYCVPKNKPRPKSPIPPKNLHNKNHLDFSFILVLLSLVVVEDSDRKSLE